MFMMTARVDKKKIAIILGAVLALVLLLILTLGGDKAQPTGGGMTINGNDDRVRFLTGHGWEVISSPTHSGQVRIPAEGGEVFRRYNDLQKTMGYDLSPYAGKTVMRYVYTVKNYPGATEPVYATILICDNRIIGGDITDTAPDGKIQGFRQNAE